MAKVKKKGKLEKSLDYLHWRHFAGAMMDVVCAMQAQANHNLDGGILQGIKPDADCWAWDSKLRARLTAAVMQRWCFRTGEDETWFPYSEDGVARLFLRYRKRNEQDIVGFEKEIEKAYGC